jgi:hypothetical protein
MGAIQALIDRNAVPGQLPRSHSRSLLSSSSSFSVKTATTASGNERGESGLSDSGLYDLSVDETPALSDLSTDMAGLYWKRYPYRPRPFIHW